MHGSLYLSLLILHILGATIWTGGHLVLATTVLPRALAARSARILLDFESSYERIGMPALVVQIVTGLSLAVLRVGPPASWLEDTPPAHVVHVKLLLLAITAGFALHAKLRVLPTLSDETLPVMAWHIVPVTVVSVLFAIAGVLFRVGGLG